MMKIGGRYNWKGQEERLSYMGCRRYPGDSRGWHQFEKVDCPGIVWCEVLEADLPMLEETVEPVIPQEDLRGSRAIAQTADMVISLTRTEVSEKDVTYVFSKERSGPGSLILVKKED